MADDRLLLGERGVVAVAGPDARALLQRLFTNDVDTLALHEARYAALLTPQGKIVSDFLVVATGADDLLLDVPASLAADLVKKLTLYRLRAKVTVENRSRDLGVVAYRGPSPAGSVVAYADPRGPGVWGRAILPREAADAWAPDDAGARKVFERARIRAGVPEGGVDFAYGETFPHEANLDRLNGVNFKKGCYVGQEVVSRVHHRGTARKRVVVATFAGAAPAPGTDIVAGETVIGAMGSSLDGVGLATVRLDRLKESAEPVRAGSTALDIAWPSWA